MYVQLADDLLSVPASEIEGSTDEDDDDEDDDEDDEDTDEDYELSSSSSTRVSTSSSSNSIARYGMLFQSKLLDDFIVGRTYQIKEI